MDKYRMDTEIKFPFGMIPLDTKGKQLGIEQSDMLDVMGKFTLYGNGKWVFNFIYFDITLSVTSYYAKNKKLYLTINILKED